MSLFLSFWMLMASTGISVNFHYCEGEIVNWSVLNSADECDHKQAVKSCCETEVVKECHNPSEPSIEKTDCCSSDQASFELETEFNLSGSEVTFTLPQLLILSQYVFPLFDTEKEKAGEVNYVTPILSYRHDSSFIQSFLI